MTSVGRLGALVALTLTLVLAACSTPDDLTTPTLEPQFGTSDNDFGVDVAYPASGRVYVLLEQEGYEYDEYGDQVGVLEQAVLNRYDSNGNLLWSEVINYGRCSYYDDCDSDPLQVRSLVADAHRYSYSLVSGRYITGDCTVVLPLYVHKYDASGNPIRSVYLGENGRPFGSTTGAAQSDAVDLAITGATQGSLAYRGGEQDGYISKLNSSGTTLWTR